MAPRFSIGDQLRPHVCWECAIRWCAGRALGQVDLTFTLTAMAAFTPTAMAAFYTGFLYARRPEHSAAVLGNNSRPSNTLLRCAI